MSLNNNLKRSNLKYLFLICAMFFLILYIFIGYFTTTFEHKIDFQGKISLIQPEIVYSVSEKAKIKKILVSKDEQIKINDPLIELTLIDLEEKLNSMKIEYDESIRYVKRLSRYKSTSAALSIEEKNYQIRKLKKSINIVRDQINENTFITSKINGIVSDNFVTENQVILPSEKLLSLYPKLHPSYLCLIQVPYNKLFNIAEGMTCFVKPKDVNTNIYGFIKGTVYEVGKIVNSNGATYADVKILLQENIETYSNLDWTSNEGAPINVYQDQPVSVIFALDTFKPLKKIEDLLRSLKFMNYE